MLRKINLIDNENTPFGSIATGSGIAFPVYQTNRSDSGHLHIHVNDLSVGEYKFVIIDISDTDNYNHTATNYIHIDYCHFSVVCDGNGDFSAECLFIEDVDSSGANEFAWEHWQGAKDTGNTFSAPQNSFPVGPELVSNKFTTHQSGFVTDWQDDVMLASTVDPTTPTVYPGNGDVVWRVNVTGGNVKNIKLNIGYHSH